MAGGGRFLIAHEDDTDVLALWVLLWIFVVLDVAGLGGIDGVITAHGAVVVWVLFHSRWISRLWHLSQLPRQRLS